MKAFPELMNAGSAFIIFPACGAYSLLSIIGVEKMSEKKLTAAVISGTVTVLVLSVLLTAVFSFAAEKSGSLDNTALFVCSIVFLCLSCMSGGIVCARVGRKKGLLSGMICGGLGFGLILILGIICGAQPDTGTLLKLAAAVISGGTGGVMGVNKRKKKRK